MALSVGEILNTITLFVAIGVGIYAIVVVEKKIKQKEAMKSEH